MIQRLAWLGISLGAFVLAACDGSTAPAATAVARAESTATPKAKCGPGSRPEPGLQGRLSQADIDSGLAGGGITCNTEIVGSYTTPNSAATVGGWKVERYVDASGRECAYYDTTNIFPLGVYDDAIGVNVLDMTDPTKPVRTEQLITPAMASPHESLLVSQSRGLLMAGQSNPALGPGIMDIYDISQDCRHPVLKAMKPVGAFSHESGISPDGRTWFTGATVTPAVTAVDISDPSNPVPIWVGTMTNHGIGISADGNRAYLADTSGKMKILDISQIQARTPNPVVTTLSELTWDNHSIPQSALPFTMKGKPYVLEFDEFGGQSKVGAARIIDVSDEKAPVVISEMRLEVHQPENFATQAGDPGAGDTAYSGYAAHYCNVSSTVDPKIVACSMILSGLRVFDITNPKKPREVAYFNAPLDGDAYGNATHALAYSRPTFVPERKEIWYTDSSSGFFAVRVTNGAWPD